MKEHEDSALRAHDRCYHLIERTEGVDDGEIGCYGGSMMTAYRALDARADTLRLNGYTREGVLLYPWQHPDRPAKTLYVRDVPAHDLDIRTVATMSETDGKPVDRPTDGKP